MYTRLLTPAHSSFSVSPDLSVVDILYSMQICWCVGGCTGVLFSLQSSMHTHPNTSILRTLFIEELDIILASCEDGCICESRDTHVCSMNARVHSTCVLLLADVWGFDEEAVDALRSMEMDDADKQLIQQFAILLPKDSALIRQLYATNLTGEVGATTHHHLSCVRFSTARCRYRTATLWRTVWRVSSANTSSPSTAAPSRRWSSSILQRMTAASTWCVFRFHRMFPAVSDHFMFVFSDQRRVGSPHLRVGHSRRLVSTRFSVASWLVLFSVTSRCLFQSGRRVPTGDVQQHDRLAHRDCLRWRHHGYRLLTVQVHRTTTCILVGFGVHDRLASRSDASSRTRPPTAWSTSAASRPRATRCRCWTRCRATSPRWRACCGTRWRAAGCRAARTAPSRSGCVAFSGVASSGFELNRCKWRVRVGSASPARSWTIASRRCRQAASCTACVSTASTTRLWRASKKKFGELVRLPVMWQWLYPVCVIITTIK